MSRWPWSVLGVEPGAEPSEIRRAYALKLKVTHPEDDPTGFQALREAYEAATRPQSWGGPSWSGGDGDEDDAEYAPDAKVPEPAPQRPASSVPLSEDAHVELWELESTLVQRVHDAAASDEDKRAALAAVLASPALENVTTHTETEAWVASLIAGNQGPADALIDPAVVAFRWDRDEGRWDTSYEVRAVLDRRDARVHLRRLKTPGGAHHEGYTLLQSPPPGLWDSLFAARKVRPVLRLLDEQPGLYADFDYDLLDQWETRLASPLLKATDWAVSKSGVGHVLRLVFLIAWMGVVLVKCVGAFDTAPENAPAGSRPTPSGWSIMDCRKKARVAYVGETAATACAQALVEHPGSLVALSDLSFVQLRTGKAETARRGWNTVLAVHPTEARALYGRGLARLALGDSEGLADIESALAVDPRVEAEFATFGFTAPVGASPGKVPVAPPPKGVRPLEVPAGAELIKPDWKQRPTGEQIDRLFPPLAQKEGTKGRVEMRCLIGVDATLQNCLIVSETPQDLGFAEAALALAGLSRISPPMANGQPVAGAQTTVPVTFSLK